MPEISGPGQKKLLESRGYITSHSIKNISLLLYYLAASGIGQLYVALEKPEDFSGLKANLLDLNPDLKIEFFNDFPTFPAEEKIDFAILADNFPELKGLEEVPKIITFTAPWYGYIRTTKEAGSLKIPLPEKENDSTQNSPGTIFSQCFAGVLAAIEAIKLCLNLGRHLEIPLYYNLFDMEFKTGEDVSVLESIVSEDPVKGKDLSNSRVLIVGSGGLGSPAAIALVLAGIKNLGLVDSDIVEISNLNRQILHSTSRIGMPKVESAEVFLKKINPEINIEKYLIRFTKENALEIIKDYDVIMDGVDNLPTRYLLNDACVLAGKPLAEAGVLRFEGIAMTILPGKGPCYRCVFPKMPPAGNIPSCSEAGVLGPVPGVMGILEAAEVVKLLTGCGRLLSGRLLIFDALELNFMTPEIKKNDECPVCGKDPSLKNLSGEYDFVCDIVENSNRKE